MVFYGYFEQELLGEIFPTIMATGIMFIGDSVDGEIGEYGKVYFKKSWKSLILNG